MFYFLHLKYLLSILLDLYIKIFPAIETSVPVTTREKAPAAIPGPSPEDPRREEPLLQTASNHSPGAGRLKLFYFKWFEVTKNSIILNIVREGLRIQFHTIPPMKYLTSNFSHSRSITMSKEISILYSKTAIGLTKFSPDQFISPIFDVPKKDTKNRRVILNLKDLNNYIVKTKFKLEGYSTIIRLIRQGDFLVSIDLTDAYLMFSMHPDFWKFLCFEFKEDIYFYKCMPFGLTSSPRIFTKVMKSVLVFLKKRGIRASAWFDDIIIAAHSCSLLLEQLYFSKILLKSLGFIINNSKSSLIPSTKMIHLGYIWDTNAFTLAVPEDKVIALKDFCKIALSQPVSLRFLQKILGTIESFRIAYIYAALHYRDLQRQVASNIGSGLSWDFKIIPSALARNDLKWWASCPNTLTPRSLKPFSPQLIITTDSSSSGWGAFTSQNKEAYGFWSDEDSIRHNNILETKAVLLAFQSLLRDSNNISILVRSDNNTTVSYINNQGGVRSESISDIIIELFEFCIKRTLYIQASFLRGKHNERADALSRRSRDHTYSITPSFFSLLCSHFNILPKSDLFASSINFKVPFYYSEGPDPQSSGIDAFLMNWPDSIYAFPPINLVQRFLSYFLQFKIEMGLVIVPYWPAQPFFPILLDLLIDTPLLFSAARMDAQDLLPRHLSKFLACAISCNQERKLEYHKNLQFVSSNRWKLKPSALTADTGKCFPIGSICKRLIMANSI